MHLSDIEASIKEKLPECEIWGDLELSAEEYYILKEKIIDNLKPFGDGYQAYLNLLKIYPAALSTLT